ncbi:MAG: relaxase [Sphingobacteriales bacterium]|nr:MAG: relaxase [Sphingobacteriales bacterium]
MVARINSSKSIQKVLNYNEQKVAKGRAVCLAAEGFLKDADRLSFYEKWQGFKRLTDLNERTATNAVHISLNFDPFEVLSNEKMVAIAAAYVQGIGFGDQPYLVYRHEDAGHPHLHIVTTNIRLDGSRISLHGLGRGASEQTRKALEQNFGLVPADRGRGQAQEQQPQKLVYGSVDLRRAIANVLEAVLPHYRYSSLPELNAILGLYGIQASRGAEGSRTYMRGGLTYQALDDRNRPVGPPLKASILPRNPGLRFLEAKFREAAVQKTTLSIRMRTQVDWVLSGSSIRDWDGFRQALNKSGIDVVLWQNQAGYIYGVTYVDHKNKAVFNGSDLGKAYSAKALSDRWSPQEILQPVRSEPRPSKSVDRDVLPEQRTGEESTGAKELLEPLLRVEQTESQQPAPGKKRRKKRKGTRPNQ